MNKELTKEKCLKALNNFWNGDCNNYQVLEQLINEHFDNPPLKFEELHEGMWVWSTFAESYVFVCRIDEEKRCIYEDYWHGDGYWTHKFEENRFYRYEVKV